MDEITRGGFERLLRIARGDTHQSRRVANFILAWWNADSLGGFDVVAVDATIGPDIATVFDWVAGRSDVTHPEEFRGGDRRSCRSMAAKRLGTLDTTRLITRCDGSVAMRRWFRTGRAIAALPLCPQ